MHDVVKILEFLKNTEKGVTKSNLKKLIEFSNNSKKIDKLLKILTERKLIIEERKKFYLNGRYNIVIGQYVFIKNKPMVCGKSLDKIEEKIEIPNIYKLEALPKDKVIAIKQGNIGKIVFILEHDLGYIHGTYIENNGIGYVIPDNELIDRDIYIPYEFRNNVLPYDKVKVEILKDASTKKPEGKIMRVFGTGYDEETEKLSLEDILEINKINSIYPLKALKQVNKLKEEDIVNEIKGRKDFTNDIIFTIDGEDSKDLDDAISIKKLNNDNYLLGVHIADVSHYVKENSILDKEAFHRGTSIYLIDTVIPMLPPRLSNQLCSLNPNEIRLTLSCEMEIDKNGKVINSQISEGYIKSKAKLNYTEVNKYFLEKNKDFEEKYPELINSLNLMKELKNILSTKRKKRGSIEFYFPESQIILNKDKKVEKIIPYPRGFANDMIEEFMLITNETVAFTYFLKQIPFIYRIHKSPTNEKYNKFLDFVNKYGYKIEKTDDINPKKIQEILSKVENSDEKLAINLMALHTMTQARYIAFPVHNKTIETENFETELLHFALATSFYCHFTSPIRRYPDLQIHRIIKDDLHGIIDIRKSSEMKDILSYIAKQSSKKERIADQVEEEYDSIKKMEYMETQYDKTFEATITNLYTNKIEVTLTNTIVGYLYFSKKQNLKLNEKEFCILDDKNKVIYELGQVIQVELNTIDWKNFQILFIKKEQK